MSHLRTSRSVGVAGPRAGRPRLRYPQPSSHGRRIPSQPASRSSGPTQALSPRRYRGAADGDHRAGRWQPGRRGARREGNTRLAGVGTPPVVRGRPDRCRDHPGQAAGGSAQQCQRAHCESAGTVRCDPAAARIVDRPEREGGHHPGRRPGVRGTGIRGRRGRLGAHRLRLRGQHRQRLWTTVLTGFPAGSAITAVRVWPGVVTVGVVPPAPPGPSTGTAPAPGGAAAPGGTPRAAGRPPPGQRAGHRPGQRAGRGRTPATSGAAAAYHGPPVEVVLRASTGRKIRVYPAAQFGGAVAASTATTVVVGHHAVTSYANHTGKVLWSRPTGTVPQAWQVDGDELYMAVAAGGYLGSAPVTALRRVSLGTGAQQRRAPARPVLPGALSLAYQGVVVFSSARWTGGTAPPPAASCGITPARCPTRGRGAGRLYLISGNTLIGVNPRPASTLARVSAASSSGLYGSARARCSASITAHSARPGAMTSRRSRCSGRAAAALAALLRGPVRHRRQRPARPGRGAARDLRPGGHPAGGHHPAEVHPPRTSRAQPLTTRVAGGWDRAGRGERSAGESG